MSGDGKPRPRLVGISARCVMLTPAGETPDGELREALNRPDLQVTSTDNEYVALAEVCAACRHDVERMKAGARGAGLILLLAYPDRLGDPAGLVHAAERYAPQTAVWMFDPASVPRLRAVKVEDLASWERPSPAAEARPSPAGPTPAGGPVGVGNPRNSPGRGASNRQLSASPAPEVVDPRREAGKDRQDGGLLSEEELAMLLAVESPGVHNEHDRPS